MYDVIVAIILVLIIVCVVYRAYGGQEHLTEQAYSLTSRGLNLPSQNGSYLGGLAVLSSAENANTVSKITPYF